MSVGDSQLCVTVSFWILLQNPVVKQSCDTVHFLLSYSVNNPFTGDQSSSQKVPTDALRKKQMMLKKAAFFTKPQPKVCIFWMIFIVVYNY